MHKLRSQMELKFPSYFPSSEVLTHFLPTHAEHRQTAAGQICSIKATPGSDAPVRTCAVSAIPGHFLKLNLAGQSCKPLCSYCKGQSEPPEQLRINTPFSKMLYKSMKRKRSYRGLCREKQGLEDFPPPPDSEQVF